MNLCKEMLMCMGVLEEMETCGHLQSYNILY